MNGIPLIDEADFARIVPPFMTNALTATWAAGPSDPARDRVSWELVRKVVDELQARRRIKPDDLGVG